MVWRTLGSAALASSLLASDLVLLTLFLNPDVSPRHEAPALLLVLFFPYALSGTVIFLLGACLGAMFRWWPRSARPPIEGLPWFTSLTFFAIGAAAALFWLNLLSYRYSIPVEFVRALAGCSVGLTASALVLVAVVADALLFPLRGRGVSAALVVLTYASGVVVPLALYPVPAPRQSPLPLATEAIDPVRRVVLLGIDGLGPDLVQAGVSRGHLPAFARILKRGASGPLASMRPTEGPPIWTTIFTGRFPRDHGVKSFGTYRIFGSETTYELLPKGALVSLLARAGLVSISPVTAGSRKSRALWDALNAFDIQAGVVRFWGTHPPERIRGFMLSHYFHLRHGDAAQAKGTLFPPDLLEEVRARAVDPGDLDPSLAPEFVDFSVDLPGDRVPWRRDLLERALAPDITYHRAGEVLRAAYDPPFFANYFYGLDVVGHTFTRFAQPERFGDVSPQAVRRYGNVVDRYAALLGRWVGEVAQTLRSGEILIVVSGYGMEPVPFWRRLLAGLEGEAASSGTHAEAPDGFIMVVGDGIRPGALVRGASILDVAPTVLYLMGLPVARDMEGHVLTEIVEDDFARAHPVTFIPSYESLAVTPTAGRTGGKPELP
jgi:predicted AlkP superfamily phosphohydrolase/phosphomutase